MSKYKEEQESQWVEVILTKEQLDLLYNYNIITSRNAMYILGLGEFYKIQKGGNKYMTTDVKLLPPNVVKGYKWILEKQYEKVFHIGSSYSQ